MTGLSLRFAARSEIGRVRRNNEDAGYAATDLLVVADGMGGHEAGELASAATVAAVVAAAASTVGADEVLSQLAEAVITSGEYIADVVAGNRDLAGMGTTMTVVALREDRIAMAHVGDSRAYVYRDPELQQMTKDHTFVQTLDDSGEITIEEAAVHPRRNLMMRAIDGIHAVEVDLSVRETREGSFRRNASRPLHLRCAGALAVLRGVNRRSEHEPVGTFGLDLQSLFSALADPAGRNCCRPDRHDDCTCTPRADASGLRHRAELAPSFVGAIDLVDGIAGLRSWCMVCRTPRSVSRYRNCPAICAAVRSLPFTRDLS